MLHWITLAAALSSSGNQPVSLRIVKVVPTNLDAVRKVTCPDGSTLTFIPTAEKSTKEVSTKELKHFSPIQGSLRAIDFGIYQGRCTAKLVRSASGVVVLNDGIAIELQSGQVGKDVWQIGFPVSKEPSSFLTVEREKRIDIKTAAFLESPEKKSGDGRYVAVAKQGKEWLVVAFRQDAGQYNGYHVLARSSAPVISVSYTSSVDDDSGRIALLVKRRNYIEQIGLGWHHFYLFRPTGRKDL